MSLQFYYEDGQGNAVDEFGNEPCEMEVDQANFPLDGITKFDQYHDLKPPEREVAAEKLKKNSKQPNKSGVFYDKHSDSVKEQFFYWIYEKDLTPGAAGKKLNIKRRTAYNWYNKHQKSIEESITKQDQPQDQPQEPPKKAGRKKILSDQHELHLKEQFLDNASATVEDAMNSLTEAYGSSS